MTPPKVTVILWPLLQLPPENERVSLTELNEIAELDEPFNFAALTKVKSLKARLFTPLVAVVSLLAKPNSAKSPPSSISMLLPFKTPPGTFITNRSIYGSTDVPVPVV